MYVSISFDENTQKYVDVDCLKTLSRMTVDDSDIDSTC